MTSVAATSDNSNSGTLSVASGLGNFLEEYGEIAAILPVLTGLFVTSRLQLRGASALLTNLAIAAVARQVVVQLKKQAHPTSIETDATQDSSSNSTTSPAEDYTIVHSTPGRLRLRLPRLMNDAIYAKRLEKLLLAEERVIGVRLNRAAASLVIHYDETGVSELELGMRLLQILDQAEQFSQPNPTEINP